MKKLFLLAIIIGALGTNPCDAESNEHKRLRTRAIAAGLIICGATIGGTIGGYLGERYLSPILENYLSIRSRRLLGGAFLGCYMYSWYQDYKQSNGFSDTCGGAIWQWYKESRSDETEEPTN